MKKEVKEYPVKTILINYKEKPFYEFLKRTVDICASGLGIILSSWLMLIIAILIKCTSKGPVLYKSIRYTKNGKPFVFLKFRSMVDKAEDLHEEMMDQDSGNSDGVRLKIKNDPRVTKIGKFLRKTSLDELPQLFNIFGGSMTIVGPRPAIASEIEKYSDREMQRLLVKQGLTCIWQCSGRSNVSFKEQVEMDIEYIEKRGFWFDIWLILKTIPAVLFAKGAE